MLTLVASAVVTASAFAEDKKMESDAPAATDKMDAKGPKPEASPGWVVVEEDVFYPFFYASLDWYDEASKSYRRKEEKAAANELHKAAGWLRLAEANAMPESKKALEESRKTLLELSDDLKSGKVESAEDLETGIAQASAALAKYHYYWSKQWYSKAREKDAAVNLRAAAIFLKHASDSAGHENGDEFMDVYKEFYGWDDTQEVPKKLESNLSSVETEVERLADTINKADQ